MPALPATVPTDCMTMASTFTQSAVRQPPNAYRRAVDGLSFMYVLNRYAKLVILVH